MQQAQNFMTNVSKSLTLGSALDSRRRNWQMNSTATPEQRLAFSLAVYLAGGKYIYISAARGFVCVERVAQRFAELTKARKGGSYQIGHAFAQLYDALGFVSPDTVGFTLIQHSDLSCPQGFIKGFADAIRLSIEVDVVAIATGSRADNDTLVESLRHFIDDHMTVCAVSQQIL